LKYFNRTKAIVLDFEDDNWINNPGLFEIETYVIERNSNNSESSYISSNNSVNGNFDLSDEEKVENQ
jgi:hypothetical protein